MRLKTEPEDFVVDEVATEGFERSITSNLEERFLVVKAFKRDCAHFDLTRSISSQFAIPDAEIGVGGIKDRRAVTSQYLTLPNLDRIRSRFVSTSITLAPSTGTATLELLGSSARRMTIGSIFGNRFSIRAQIDEQERMRLATHGLSVQMPNYFGSQRFGRNRENVAIGYALLSGDFRSVRDTLLSGSSDDPIAFVRRIARRKRMLYVSAFQSALFNAELIDRIAGGVFDRIEHSSDRIAQLALIADARIYRSSYGSADEALPIVSLGSPLTAFQKRMLELFALSPRSFAIRQLSDMMFEPVMRTSLIDVTFESFVVGEDLRATFFLPKGSYATVLFEQLAV